MVVSMEVKTQQLQKLSFIFREEYKLTIGIILVYEHESF